MLRLFLASLPAEVQGYIEGRRCGPEFLNPLFINVPIARMNFGGELFPSAATISYLFPLTVRFFAPRGAPSITGVTRDDSFPYRSGNEAG